MINKILPEIDQVFRLEIETLNKVREQLTSDYSKAVDLMFTCLGKVIISGAGKSGLIAQKIAATMVSTGTYAMSLHPGDALHGDAGAIRQGDVFLAISKSGETDELLSLLPFLKKIEVPVISITASPHSTLATNSDIHLYTPVEAEACPLNLAPTSSTTAALVVGDALAMALMNLRGFQAENFAQVHPGGQLGKRLITTVADIMRSGDNNPLVNIGDTVPSMLYEITRKMTGAVSVVDNVGTLQGLVTDHDIRKVLEGGSDLFSLRICDIMNDNPTYVRSSALATEALRIMEDRESPFLVLPVLDSGHDRVVGMIHIHDIVSLGL